MLLQVWAYMIAVTIYIDRTALFIIRIYFIYYHCYYFFLCVCVCVVQYMCLSCSIDLVSICANKEIYNNTVCSKLVTDKGSSVIFKILVTLSI